jgi:hypothetical protein
MSCCTPLRRCRLARAGANRASRGIAASYSPLSSAHRIPRGFAALGADHTLWRDDEIDRDDIRTAPGRGTLAEPRLLPSEQSPPATMNDEVLAEARAANPFRFTQTSPRNRLCSWLQHLFLARFGTVRFSPQCAPGSLSFDVGEIRP